ncbi:MAG: class I SAM-dependent methyltransferase [Candidatus Aminicenantaceae bacterium]
MSAEDIFFEIHQDLPREGPGRDKYTRKAFKMLPGIDNPRILDIGCGPGGPTMELARLSNGRVIGLDTHRPYLDKLERKIEKAGFSHRMEAVHGSMFDMDFPEESFDIIWAEGSIFIIGFERGLKEWRRFLKPRGFMVVHEMAWLQPDPPKEIHAYWQKVYPQIMTVQENLELIPECSYKIIEHFPLPEDAWWEEYYTPLEERIKRLRAKYRNNPKALAELDNEQQEIDLYRKYSKWYGSVFFIMQKK